MLSVPGQQQLSRRLSQAKSVLSSLVAILPVAYPLFLRVHTAATNSTLFKAEATLILRFIHTAVLALNQIVQNYMQFSIVTLTHLLMLEGKYCLSRFHNVISTMLIIWL
jgi:hypothetical protein